MKTLFKNLARFLPAPVLLFLFSELSSLDWNLYLDPKWAPIAGLGVGMGGMYARSLLSAPSNDLEDAK